MLIVATVNTRHYLIIISRWDMMIMMREEETLEEGLLAGETMLCLGSEPLCCILLDLVRKNAKRKHRRVGDSLRVYTTQPSSQKLCTYQASDMSTK